MAFHAIYAKIAGKSANMLADHLLKVLLNIDSKLNIIETRLKKIQQSPYVAGIELLKKANAASTDAKRKELISDAAGKFNDALSQNDGSLKAVSYFFSGCCYDLLDDPSIALQEYEAAFRAACEFEKEVQVMIANRSSIINAVKMGSTGVGAVGGGVVGFGLAMAPWLAGVTFAAVTLPSAPVIAAVIGGGMLLGASPFFLTTKAGEVGINMYMKKFEQQAEDFFKFFTVPIAELLVERNCNEDSAIISCVKNGARPTVALIEDYLGNT
jgi:hypothetical protein